MKKLRYLIALVVIMASLPAFAEVEVKIIKLSCVLSEAIYAVPAGKVFIVEHVVFSDYWNDSSELKQLQIRPYSSIAGSMWQTTLTYNAVFTTLPRPLKMPAGSTIGVFIKDDSALKVYIYGLLVDAADIYAAIPSRIDNVALASSSSLSGEVVLASPRPSIVKIQKSTDLQQWSTDPAVRVSSTSAPAVKDIEVDISGTKGFLRSSARARQTE